MTCEFANTDRDESITKSRSYTLTQLLDAGKAMEMSKAQADNIEGKQEINQMSGKYNKNASNIGIKHPEKIASVGTAATSGRQNFLSC